MLQFFSSLVFTLKCMYIKTMLQHNYLFFTSLNMNLLQLPYKLGTIPQTTQTNECAMFFKSFQNIEKKNQKNQELVQVQALKENEIVTYIGLLPMYTRYTIYHHCHFKIMIISYQNFHKLFFLLSKWILKIKTITWLLIIKVQVSWFKSLSSM